MAARDKTKTTGYKIQHALRELAHRRDIVENQFRTNLEAFPDEQKKNPTNLDQQLLKIERVTAGLQVLQARYNLAVPCKVAGFEAALTLHDCVKLVGAYGRAEKRWRTAAKEKESSGYYGSEKTRDRDALVSSRTVPIDTAVEMATTYGRRANALREAIQTGNTTELEFEGVSDLFEFVS